jgi:hypothetical protein
MLLVYSFRHQGIPSAQKDYIVTSTFQLVRPIRVSASSQAANLDEMVASSQAADLASLVSSIESSNKLADEKARCVLKIKDMVEPVAVTRVS